MLIQGSRVGMFSTWLLSYSEHLGGDLYQFGLGLVSVLKIPRKLREP